MGGSKRSLSALPYNCLKPLSTSGIAAEIKDSNKAGAVLLRAIYWGWLLR